MKRNSCMDEIEYERRTSKRQAIEMDVCLFCQKGDEEDDLHQVLTFDADTNIRTMIAELQDTTLLCRIDGGDLITKSDLLNCIGQPGLSDPLQPMNAQCWMVLLLSYQSSEYL